ncbi:TIGR04222 domain-containing membrane protein [Streptomyces sp. NPDC051940]|uniref:TIGR04222 domain-containing membrane protein n=1 Tax=Streptomyces sp. NPDC051940 TaxID=3155675 RepID=UPI003413D47E
MTYNSAMWVMFVFLAWAFAVVSCGRLCRAAVVAGRWPEPAAEEAAKGELSLYEIAFLAGGPRRVADLTLVRMARARRLLLAHTGWATVVDPVPHDALERGVLEAVGPDGQARVPEVRAAAAASEPMTALGEALARDGLATPPRVRAAIRAGVRQVRLAGLVVLVLWLLATALTPPGSAAPALHGWFVLPLLLVGGSLLIARIEIHPYTRWASYAGQQALARFGVPRPRSGEGDPGSYDEGRLLSAVAVSGPRVLPEPELRAAFGE